MPSFGGYESIISWLPGNTGGSVIIGTTAGTGDTTPTGADVLASFGLGRCFELVSYNVSTAGAAASVMTINAVDTAGTSVNMLTYPVSVTGSYPCGRIVVPAISPTSSLKQTIGFTLPITAVVTLVYRVLA